MSKIIDLIDDKIQISPECLVIEPFKTIWESDKAKTKEKATKAIEYIWFFSDFNSPFFQQNPNERHKLITEYIIKDKDYQVNDLIKQGLETYNKLNTTPSMRLFMAVQESISKMETFFKEIEYNEDNITKIQKAIVDMPKLQAAVQEALENCKKENSSSIRVRGNADVGLFE